MLQTHSEYALFIAFALQELCTDAPQFYVIRKLYVLCLEAFSYLHVAHALLTSERNYQTF